MNIANKILILMFFLFLAFYSNKLFANGNLRQFENNEWKIKISYPQTWFLKEEKINDDTNTFYFSKEPIKTASDNYKTGIAVFKIINADKHFKPIVKENPDLTRRMWIEQERTDYILHNQLISEEFEFPVIGGESAILYEVSLKSGLGYDLKKFELVLFKDNTLVVMVLEAPLDEFETYRAVFTDILKGASFF